VAGSTWPGDDAVLVPACVELRRAHPTLRVIVAAHEPEERGMAAIEEHLRAEGWTTVRIGEVERAGSVDADLVVVDRVGVLAELYSVGDLAYVGGGFHPAGLHSVLEPAAAGLPVVFGPRHRSSAAAGDLIERGAAAEVLDVATAVAALSGWLADPTARASAGTASLDYIRVHRGAAERTAALLSELMGGAGAR
jgi:3-deoxy-D-manno-octulosonic-acid transferase